MSKCKGSQVNIAALSTQVKYTVSLGFGNTYSRQKKNWLGNAICVCEMTWFDA